MGSRMNTSSIAVNFQTTGAATFLGRTIRAASLAMALVGCMAETEGNPKAGQAQQQALVTSDLHAVIRRVGSDVEVEVTAPEPFPDRAMPPVIVIGDKAFGRSRASADGHAETLVFTIDAEEFDALPDNSDVSVGFLSSAARLLSPDLASSGNTPSAAERGPTIRPDQVEAKRRRAGTFRKSRQEVVP